MPPSKTPKGRSSTMRTEASHQGKSVRNSTVRAGLPAPPVPAALPAAPVVIASALPPQEIVEAEEKSTRLTVTLKILGLGRLSVAWNRLLRRGHRAS
jgi:hypothetical protein